MRRTPYRAFSSRAACTYRPLARSRAARRLCLQRQPPPTRTHRHVARASQLWERPPFAGLLGWAERHLGRRARSSARRPRQGRELSSHARGMRPLAPPHTCPRAQPSAVSKRYMAFKVTAIGAELGGARGKRLPRVSPLSQRGRQRAPAECRCLEQFGHLSRPPDRRRLGPRRAHGAARGKLALGIAQLGVKELEIAHVVPTAVEETHSAVSAAVSAAGPAGARRAQGSASSQSWSTSHPMRRGSQLLVRRVAADRRARRLMYPRRRPGARGGTANTAISSSQRSSNLPSVSRAPGRGSAASVERSEQNQSRKRALAARLAARIDAFDNPRQ